MYGHSLVQYGSPMQKSHFYSAYVQYTKLLLLEYKDDTVTSGGKLRYTCRSRTIAKIAQNVNVTASVSCILKCHYVYVYIPLNKMLKEL